MSRVVSSNLARLRRRARRSQADLASAMGFTQAYVSHIERGRMEIKEEWVFKWASLLEARVDEFYDEKKAVSWAQDPLGLAEFVERHRNPPAPVEVPEDAKPLKLVGGIEGEFYEGDEIADMRELEAPDDETMSDVQANMKRNLDAMREREEALLKRRPTDKTEQRTKRTNTRQMRLQKF